MHVKTTKKVSELEDKSNVTIFIGYELGTTAYRCLHLLNFKESISRYVIFEETQCCDFSQEGGQCVHFTFTSAIDMVNSYEISTKNQNSNSTSDVPSYEHIDQVQISKEEERPERFISIQSIYEETQGIEEDEICFIS